MCIDLENVQFFLDSITLFYVVLNVNQHYVYHSETNYTKKFISFYYENAQFSMAAGFCLSVWRLA
jgi:hypothetical protein